MLLGSGGGRRCGGGMNAVSHIARAVLPYAVFERLRNWRADRIARREWREYLKGSWEPPPHEVKVRRVLEYAGRFGLRVLVETGTYHGDMVRRTMRYFNQIYSIELSMPLWREAERRFRPISQVAIIQGESHEGLRQVLRDLNEAALFWLDAHYSGGETAGEEASCPLEEELRLVLAHPVQGHVILIDDARYLGTMGYPSFDAVVKLVNDMRKGYKVERAEDIVRVTP